MNEAAHGYRIDSVKDLIACCALVAAAAVLYSKVLGLWWTYDDAFHLHLCTTYSLRSILMDRGFWQHLPNRVFTPLLFLSLKTDLLLWGAVPRAFYVHHLLAFGALVIATYLVARLWLTRLSAFAVALLAISGPPMCEIVEQLFHRHYLEGLILAVASVGLFVKSLRSEKTSVGSAVAYFCAMAAKEVYVPLIVILFAIPEHHWRARWKRLLPHCAGLMLYLTWRFAMLGPSLEGYGLVPGRSKWLEMIDTLPWRAVQRIGGHGSVQAILFLALLAASIATTLIRAPHMRVMIILMIFAALLPIAPVAVQMETRFVLVLWMCGAAAAAAAPRWLLAPLLVAAMFANRAEWTSSFQKTDRMATEARFFARMTRGQLLRNPLVPPAALPELAWLTKSAGAWLYDDSSICTGDIPGRLYAWYEPLGTIREENARFVRLTECRRVTSMPLNVTFDYEPQTLFWHLGPYRDGTYAFVLAGGHQAFDVPRDAGFRVGNTPGLTVRVRYTSPSGWITYSPEMNLDFAHQPDVTWLRR